MVNIFNRMARHIRQSFDGLSEDMPKIEWIKAVDSYATVAFAARYSFKAAAKISGADIIIKAEDGRFFTRKKWDKKPVWHGKVEGEQKTFRSPYLDTILAQALEQGMTSQPSAHDIFSQTCGPGSMRYFMIWNASDEDFKNLDRDYPAAPNGFNDYHTPEDYDDSHPHFAAYLRKRGYVPFRLNTPQPKAEQAIKSQPK